MLEELAVKSLEVGNIEPINDIGLNKQFKKYFDDNNEIYRINDDLLPNHDYDLNGYSYRTDEYGRIASVEGTLHSKMHEGRLPIKDSLETIGKGDELPGDDRGHLIADQFDGSNGLENMIPQDAEINRKDFNIFENKLAQELKEGKEIFLKMEPVYDGVSRRPTDIVANYSINAKEYMRIFPNKSETKI